MAHKASIAELSAKIQKLKSNEKENMKIINKLTRQIRALEK